jgi:3-methyladenine DNA glycosylase AlkD
MKTTNLNPKEYGRALALEYKKAANSVDAVYMAKYMKNHFVFFGLKSTPRNETTKIFYASHGFPPSENWKDYIKECWLADEREIQIFGQELCMKYKKLWVANDLDFFEYLITTKSWWDSVDYIASNIIGQYFWMFPEKIKPTIDKWKFSDNMWLVRTALIFQLKYKDHTDFNLLQDVIHHNKYSKEFFIQKAIGWALRQYAKFSPEDVQAFVTETELKPLSRREALKHIT